MSDLEYMNPLYEASIKLCAAIKKYKCLHDKSSVHKYPTTECEAAWQLVALECNETAEYCKKRWKTLRRCFFQGLKRRGNRYYLHEHLKFLENEVDEQNRNCETILNDDSNISDTMPKRYNNGDIETINVYDDNDTISVSSQTTNKDEDNAYTSDKNTENEKRLTYKRSCKRPLDHTENDELSSEELDDKRSRNTLTNDTTPTTKQCFIKAKKLKINMAQNKSDSDKVKMIDCAASTDSIETKDIATQYEPDPLDFDDIFMQTVKTQLQQMNPRQKMNFKCKIYKSFLEVLDDATDFPNKNEPIQLQSKQAPIIGNSTIGELRLMRELVALVQAAKNTPEIMNSNETFKISPQAEKSLVKTPAINTENFLNTQTSPLALSPTLDDDDLQSSIGNIEDINNVSNFNEMPNSIKRLPRHILQKVVKVAGSATSTIVTRDGDKKRIYRIYPKLLNPNPTENQARVLPIKTSNNVGTFFVSNVKDSHPANNKLNSNANEATKYNKPTNLNVVTNSTNFKNAHTNSSTRILSSSTGLFKSISPTNTNNSSSALSAGATPSNPMKTAATTLPTKPMLPPSSNFKPKRIEQARLVVPTMQRRYSICGPLPADQLPTPSSNVADKRTQDNSSISQIKISQPISLNSQRLTSAQTISRNNNLKTVGEPVSSAANKETAGTIETDCLDPLFMSQPTIKSEPDDL